MLYDGAGAFKLYHAAYKVQPLATAVTFSPVSSGLSYHPKNICPSLTGATYWTKVPTLPVKISYTLVDDTEPSYPTVGVGIVARNALNTS